MQSDDNQSPDKMSEEALFELLSLERRLVPGREPPYGGYASRWHSWNHRWRTRDGVDEVFYNAEGKRHRLYGPAYTSTRFSITEWYKDGELHRIGGPAVVHKGIQVWYKDGKRHNLDGPAVITGGGPKEYWIEGAKLPPKEFKREIARRKRKGLL